MRGDEAWVSVRGLTFLRDTSIPLKSIKDRLEMGFIFYFYL